MSTFDTAPTALIARWEASLRTAYAHAGDLTGNEDDATALLMAALEDAFADRPDHPPSQRELIGRISGHASACKAA